MSNILEKSLDDIIGEKKPERKFTPTNRRGRGGGPRGPISRFHRQHRSPPYSRRQPDVYIPRGAAEATTMPSSSSSIPPDVLQLANGRPTLRLKNIHPDLNGDDLNKLFSTINDVDFIKFDEKNDTIAYICFQNDCERSNLEAIEKYDGKKAMQKILIVENTISLADRISIAPRPVRREGLGGYAVRNRGGSRGRISSRRGGGGAGAGSRSGRGPAPKKSAEELDKELNDYMGKSDNGDAGESNGVPEQGNVDTDLDMNG
ncbi:C-terminal duplication domain of Friend of PRMT1 family protein [Candida parapsilosis]|uniref:FoP_duplication domain-containing protein n=2 Tax=Candida parapsilosis TaxID=5480 RepID=G8BA40_CANPC|nr:uncharacterized protein CPAR2_804620 [Candida parapsilosis]KAF6051813.1 C-terminal duplication domain of Friend of PRMT1 family protein [Candida parapsilosis]KAF6052690.1 C-terminal duplication domain of Friend of PRMT1 family protein [Candida parapsilosis]KAF6053615.1 C-terminal duplication domain of Friend of PRMT1 family protein [Candida parapsilosis]KAF6064467.1 C-terminal duplication domain of Friend of PRMT1 family protein [Candida parapsilosis]KAI5903910.1 hypothetical protein K4G60_